MGEVTQNLKNQGKAITRQFISITSFHEKEQEVKCKTRSRINLEIQHFGQRRND